MKVAVLLAGIADPKWPVGAAQPRILSPFDESALEVALKLRDADPSTRIAIRVAGDETLARTAAAYRPDLVRRVDIPGTIEWDAGAQATMWRAIVLEESPDLVVMGREFGDRDDGSLPACLAESLGWSYTALVQEIRANALALEMRRERGDVEERIERPAPALASITNDRRNKLRHPLLKNVMAAKRMAIEAQQTRPANVAAVSLEALEPATPARRDAPCRVLAGPVEAQVEALAEFLRPWRRAA